MKSKIIGKSKIPWCTHGWNFVVGCSRRCSGNFRCYAMDQMERYKMHELFAIQEARWLLENTKVPHVGVYPKLLKSLNNFRPTFLEHAFAKRFPKKPSSIFICAMTDPAYWKLEWTERAFEKIKQHPEHTFIMLTKSPRIYAHMEPPPNVAVGVTALNENDIKISQECLKNLVNKNTTFLSIEPLQCEIYPACIDTNIIDLVIVGGLSGPGVQPKKEWVNGFEYYSVPWIEGHYGKCCSYFEKNNLQKIVNRELIQELPWVTSRRNFCGV